MTGPAPSVRAPFEAARLGRHPALRTIALLLGGIVTVLLVSTAAVAVAGILVRTSESSDDTVTGSIQRVQAAVSGSIVVRPGPPDQVRVERRSRYSFDRPQVDQELHEGILDLRMACSGLTVICDHQIELTVPPEVALDLAATHIVVEGTTGPVDVRAGGGSLELRGTSGPVTARVDGGAIDGRDIRSADVHLSAGAGSIQVAFTRPPEDVSASAGAGHVEVVLPPDDTRYRVEAKAGAGDTAVSVRTDPASDHVVRARTGAGSVIVRYGPG